MSAIIFYLEINAKKILQYSHHIQVKAWLEKHLIFVARKEAEKSKELNNHISRRYRLFWWHKLIKITGNCSRLWQHIFQLLEGNKLNKPNAGIKKTKNKQTLKQTFWFDPIMLIALNLDNAEASLFHNVIMSTYVFLRFIYFCSQCLQWGRLLVWVHMSTFDIRSKSFWKYDRFSSPKAHRCYCLPTWLNCLCHISVACDEIFVSFLCIQRDWNGLFHTGDKPLLTHFLHASLETQRGLSLDAGLPPLLFILLNHLWWRMLSHIKLHIFCIKNVPVE